MRKLLSNGRRELMTVFFHKFICLLTFCFILISPVTSQQPDASQQPIQRELKRYTTYQTSLTNEDIMRSFVNEVRTYLERYDRYGGYYFVIFEVFQDRNEQNWPWQTGTLERVYQFGTIYTIGLGILNARLHVHFSNTSFRIGGQSAQRIESTSSDTMQGNRIRQHIVNTATSMFDESEMVLKMNSRYYSDESKTTFLTEIIRIMQ